MSCQSVELSCSKRLKKAIGADLLDCIVKGDSSVTRLDLSKQRLQTDDAVALAQILVGLPNVTILDASDNKIGNPGLEAIVSTEHLTTIILSLNDIDDSGAKVLASSTRLTTLDLSYNSIKGLGAAALARNRHLLTLNLSGNDIDDLARAFVENLHLTSLNLDENLITDDVTRLCQQAIARNRYLYGEAAVVGAVLRSWGIPSLPVGVIVDFLYSGNKALTRRGMNGVTFFEKRVMPRLQGEPATHSAKEAPVNPTTLYSPA